jgi:large subunit ribosomal protein L19
MVYGVSSIIPKAVTTTTTTVNTILTTASFSAQTIAPPIAVVHPNVEWDPVAPEDMPYLHHGKRPRYRDYIKFKSPRRRASALYTQLQQEAIAKSIAAKPKVWETPFQVGDAIEIENVEEGGVNAKTTEKIRGVVLGIFRKRLDHSILIRDVVFGEPVETRIPLHSPLIRSIKILEKNFVHKGKKKIKRAKLYYLSERNPLGTSFSCCVVFYNLDHELLFFHYCHTSQSIIIHIYLSLFRFIFTLFTDLTETQVTKW